MRVRVPQRHRQGDYLAAVARVHPYQTGECRNQISFDANEVFRSRKKAGTFGAGTHCSRRCNKWFHAMRATQRVAIIAFRLQKYSVSALTRIFNSGKTIEVMSRWNASTSTLILLGSVMCVVLLLVVLPDVDPPDTAFHRGTAPVALHTQANAAPPLIVAVPCPPRVATAQRDWLSLRLSKTAVLLPPTDRPLQLCPIRC